MKNTLRIIPRIAVIMLFIATCTAILNIAQAADSSNEPPSDPILRPNTTMHTAKITSAAIDKDERFLVTASEDKTAKVWSLASGELLQTLRVPIGDTNVNEGKLFAIAIDPNGEWIAVGGWTGYQWDKNVSVYLFNRHNGQLLRRLSGLGVIGYLCVSEDGSRLAATLGGSDEVRVWNTADWSLAWQDSDYGKGSYGCDFAGDNRLATTSLDGHVRLYSPEGRLLKKQRTKAGKEPYSIAFNPTGDSLAVGFYDNTSVVVYDGNTLDKRFAANTSAFANRDLSEVAWSTDGSFLYAGGRYDDGSGMNPVIRWSQGGRGKATALPGSQNTIIGLLPLRAGGLLVAANDPTWLQLSANGKVKRQQHNVIVDNRGKLGNDFLLSKDGQQLAFGLGYGGKQPVRFSLGKRQLQNLSEEQFNQLQSQGFIAANTNKLGVSDWQNQDHPKLNGKALSFKDYERSRSLAIAPDNDSFLLGTGLFLRKYQAGISPINFIVGTKTTFTVGSATLSAKGKKDFQELAKKIKKVRKEQMADLSQIVVVGHTDTTGDVRSNQTLSEKRAITVGNFLVSQGIPSREITAYGEGELSPITSNANEIGREQNRRVEIRVEGTKAGTGKPTKLLWGTALPSVAWGVNLSADGKLAVAALGDGTIRWYRYSDGQELLALFIDKNSKEWVLWTPSGYYDASSNGDKLIGWHLDNGKDKTPDFYPAKTLRKKIYRPQIISHILTTLDEAKAIRLVNELGGKTNAEQTIAASLPPTVKIISHHNGDTFTSEQVTLRIKVTRDKGTEKLKVLIDGEPMAKDRDIIVVKQQGEELAVTLPKRDVTVTVIAENDLGASPPASVRLKWAGKTPASAGGNGQFAIKPKLYILAVGVSKYRDENLRLDFPAKDAADFVKVLQGQQDKLYREVEVRLLADADKDDIIDGLDWLRDNVTAKDVTMLFLSGHGANDRDNNYQFVAADTDVKRLYRSGVSYTDIKNTLTGLSGKRLAFIDTCHSGNIFGTKSKGLSPMADINGIVNDLTAAENGVVVFAASTGKQLSWEDPKWGNGAFTKAVVEGLSGKADYTQDGKITINQLDLYISERVKVLTNNRQTPVTAKPETLPDFPIGVVK